MERGRRTWAIDSMTEREGSPGELSAEHDARDWVMRMSSGEMSRDELRQLHAWLDASGVNRQAFERERALWRDLAALEHDFAPVGSSTRRRVGASRWRASAGGGVLAAGLALMVIWFGTDLPRRWSVDHATGVGEQATIRLPDGSLAFLNSDSAIDVRYQGGLRLVLMRRGEALFEVKHDADSTFRVAAAGSNTDATGTAFATRVSAGEVTVTVATGSVRVFGPAAPDAPTARAYGAVDLKADQQLSYAENARPSAVSAVSAADALAWRGGSIVFDGRPFALAIAEIGRYIPERVVVGDGAMKARPVSGMFSIRSPYNAIEALAATQGFAVYRIPHIAIFIR